MEFQVEIVRLDDQGRGIGYIDGKIVFVENALPEEIVRVFITKEKKKFYEAKVIKKIVTSSDRITPKCLYYDTCGGCNLMHLNDLKQLEYKKNKGIQILKKFAGIEIEDTDIIASDAFHYRNKVIFHVEHGKIGYYQKESHNFVEINQCLLLHPKINELLTVLKGANFLNTVGKIMIRTFQDGLETQIVFYPQENLNQEEIIHRIKDLVTSIYVDRTCIYGNDEILEKIGDRNYLVRPESFFQVNTKTTKKLYDQVKEKLEPSQDDVVLDLYCGAGTIGLYIAPYVKYVYGVEIVKEAIMSANKNKEINRTKNIEFYVGDSKTILEKFHLQANKVIVDPPRSGLDQKTKEYLLNIKPERIVYVSCNPVTLARDIKDLSEKYQFQTVTFVDMFPNTDHVESVAVLRLKDGLKK